MSLQHFSIGRDLPLPESTCSGFVNWLAEGLYSEQASCWHKTAAEASRIALGVLLLLTVIFYRWFIDSIATAKHENSLNEKREREIQARKDFIEALGGDAAVEALPCHTWADEESGIAALNFNELNGFDSTDPISKGVIGERHYVILRIHDLERDEFFTQALVETAEPYRDIIDYDSNRYEQEFQLRPGLINRPRHMHSIASLRSIDGIPFLNWSEERPLSQAILQRISEIVKGQHARFKLTNAPMQPVVRPLPGVTRFLKRQRAAGLHQGSASV